MKSNRFILRSAAAALSLMLLSGGVALAGPGHGSGKSSDAMGQPGKASEVSRTIEIEMHDSYYTPESIAVKPGETVRFVIRNAGELVHEFNIGTVATHLGHQKEMERMVEHGVLEADRINHGMMNMKMSHGRTMAHDDPNSVLLEPGETRELIWKFAEKPGLEFACNVPGHYDAGMMGRFRFN